jgi:8-oxo-dGTP pyrophosphatase MutT (NUDIX family)
MNHWESTIRDLLENDLPGISSHGKILPPGRDLNIPASHNSQIKNSGVLILVYPEEDDLFTCLIKRPMHMKIHAGQIGFPGGKQERKDKTPCDTAIRETVEEIGVDKTRIRILGSLSPLYVSVSNFLIYPYVAWTDARPSMSINRHEVEEYYFFPLWAYLREPKIVYSEIQTISGTLKAPGIPFGGEFIWGATAMILQEFLDILSKAETTLE